MALLMAASTSFLITVAICLSMERTEAAMPSGLTRKSCLSAKFPMTSTSILTTGFPSTTSVRILLLDLTTSIEISLSRSLGCSTRITPLWALPFTQLSPRVSALFNHPTSFVPRNTAAPVIRGVAGMVVRSNRPLGSSSGGWSIISALMATGSRPSAAKAPKKDLRSTSTTVDSFSTPLRTIPTCPVDGTLSRGTSVCKNSKPLPPLQTANLTEARISGSRKKVSSTSSTPARATSSPITSHRLWAQNN